METTFTTLESKIFKETVFTHFVNSEMEIKSTPNYQTADFENVLHIGCNKRYGDVFKCWISNPNDFIIYFGTKGDEFNQ